MRKILAAAALSALLFTTPAKAATADERGQAWMVLAAPCQTARKDTVPPEQLIETCQQVLATLATTYAARAPQDDAEANYYWLVVLGSHARIGSAMGRIDKVRSRRVCDHVFRQAEAAANFKLETAAPDFAAGIAPLLESVASTNTQCRSE